MIWYDSKLTIKRFKSLCVKDFSQAVHNSISDKSHYMEEDIEGPRRRPEGGGVNGS
jgi:hypothetical protein